jgi:hypothetical protein
LLTYGLAGVLIVGFVALVALLAIQHQRLRVWKRAHQLVTGDYRDMRSRYFALKARHDSLLDDVEGEVLHLPESADAEREVRA